MDGGLRPNTAADFRLDRRGVEAIVVESKGTGCHADSANHAAYRHGDLTGLSWVPVPDHIPGGFESRKSSPRQMFWMEP